MSELKKNSVERTLCIPLWSRAIAVKKLPEILPDYDAVRILKEMGEKRPPSVLYYLESGALAGAMRQYDFACEIKDYLKDHPQAVVVELGAGLSCLRRQMKNETSEWINIDFPDVIKCREKYIPKGEKERNLAFDITDHRWFCEVPFQKERGAVFLAAGVLHYLEYNEVKKLISEMAKQFPGALFVFDYISRKGMNGGNIQIRMTKNSTSMKFSIEDAEKEISAMSSRVSRVVARSYLEGYPHEKKDYSLLTRAYIRSKRDRFFVAHVEFQREETQ